MNTNSKYHIFQFPSLSLATIVTIMAIVAMTLVAELNGGFKGFLADLTGHHWESKGLLALGIFLVTWLASSLVLKEKPHKMRAWALAVVGVCIGGILVIFLFFLGHYLGA